MEGGGTKFERGHLFPDQLEELVPVSSPHSIYIALRGESESPPPVPSRPPPLKI